MDGANHVHDEVSVELRRGIKQLFGINGADGAVYRVDYRPVRDLYRRHLCV